MGYQEELAQLKKEQEKRNAAIAAQNEALQAQLNANAQALAQQQAQNEAAIEAEQQRQQQNFADLALQYKKDYDNALAEDAALRQQEDKRAVWTGVTEGLASLANLVGVGSFNSANQTYHSYSKDWMDKADQERRIRRNRIDNIRERQRAMEQQLAQLRGNQNMQLINLRGQNADKRFQIGNQIATTMAGLGREDANRRAADAAQNASMAISQGNAERQFNEAARARQAQEGETQRYHDMQIEAQMARYGYQKGTDGKWSYTGKVGSGSGSTIKLALSASGELPEEIIEIKPGSLISLNANIDNVSDLDDKDKKAIKMVLTATGSEDDKAKKLTKYAVKSPELRRILRNASVSSAEMQSASSAPATSVEDNAVEDRDVLDANALDKILGL